MYNSSKFYNAVTNNILTYIYTIVAIFLSQGNSRWLFQKETKHVIFFVDEYLLPHTLEDFTRYDHITKIR